MSRFLIDNNPHLAYFSAVDAVDNFIEYSCLIC